MRSILTSTFHSPESWGTKRNVNFKMEFLAIESLRISLKLNISAAREQQAVGLGPLV